MALVIGCSRQDAGQAPASGPHKLSVVASIFPLADVARVIGGDRVDVVTLLPPGQSPHEFEPKPRQAESLAAADLLITVGLGLDTWADRAAQAAGSRVPHTIVFADLLPKPAGEHPTGPDPHVWLDPTFMMLYVDALARTFSSLDLDHAPEYAARAERYRADLVTLDEQYRRELSVCPNKSFVCFHAAYGYLASRYGLTQVSLMDVSGAGFGSRRIETVITFIREHHIKTIFAEPDEPEEQLRAIAVQTGTRVERLDDVGNPTVPGYDSYLALMRSNLAALVKALKE